MMLCSRRDIWSTAKALYAPRAKAIFKPIKDSLMFKRNQVEEAIARVLEPGSGKTQFENTCAVKAAA